MGFRLIAPCGMNCGICMAYLRDKNICKGCWSATGYKSNSCLKCCIKNCKLLANTDSKFCYDCAKFPCARLKSLDKRYRLKYRMSMLENLHYIKESGLENFEQKEVLRWKCDTCGGTICVHRGFCLKCNNQNNPVRETKSTSTEIWPLIRIIPGQDHLVAPLPFALSKKYFKIF